LSSFSESDRAHELEIIRRRYAQYAHSDRHDLWSLSNPGFRRLVEERDAAIMRLVQRSLPWGGGTVVDLGAGSSRLAGVAHDLALDCRWIGVDIDPDAIARSADEYPWAEFVLGSADRLPTSADSIDVALASVLFSSLPSRQFEAAVAAELKRVLRPGGWLVWYDLRYGNPWNSSVHGIDRRRLATLFPSWAVELRSSTVLPPLARRLGLTTPILYPILEAIPPLRSHLIGRLQCPT
jgi:SAM-dependent methyltransferase